MNNNIRKFAEFSAIADAEELASVAATSLRAGRVAYVEAGKALVALDAATQDSRKSDKLLQKKGASAYEIRSGRIMANVYKTFVQSGHVSEDEFAEITLANARDFESAAQRRSVEKMKAAGVFSLGVKAMATEMALIAETGKTKPERETGSKTAEKVEEDSTGKTAENTTATETGKTAKATPQKEVMERKSPLVEFHELLAGAERIATALIKSGLDEDVESIRLRADAFDRLIASAIEKRKTDAAPAPIAMNPVLTPEVAKQVKAA